MFSWRSDGEFVFLVGQIDQSAKLEEVVAKSKEPLRLNFREMTGLSSIGMKKFFELLEEWNPRAFEFHECPQTFVFSINGIPQLLGPKRDAKVVKSAFAPFTCTTCNTSENHLIKLSEVHMDGTDLKVPARRCRTCRSALKMDVDPHDYFLFTYA